jgi:hypothetical protein
LQLGSHPDVHARRRSVSGPERLAADALSRGRLVVALGLIGELRLRQWR